MGALSVADLTDLIRDIPDFPEPEIVFKDITPLLAHADELDATIACWRRSRAMRVSPQSSGSKLEGSSSAPP